MAHRRSSRTSTRDYPRSARLNELVREILGEELERLDDERLELVSISGVRVTGDLSAAMVYFDVLDADDDESVIEALEEHRGRLKVAIGRQARVRRVPDLTFAPDPAVRGGEHIDAILREIGPIVDSDATDAALDAVTDADPGARADADGEVDAAS